MSNQEDSASGTDCIPSPAFLAMENKYFSSHFPYLDGWLCCEGVKVAALRDQLQQTLREQTGTPFFLYSQTQIEENIAGYQSSLRRLPTPSSLNFAVKANMNPHLLRLMKEAGCSLTLVSGLELQLALRLGFPTDHMVFNGNGKQAWEIRLAVDAGCLLNIDSDFNLQQTVDICNDLNRSARVLLRVNPDIDPHVHHYISTGREGCKFGMDPGILKSLKERLLQETRIKVVGLHCHLGSTIDDLQVFRKCAGLMMSMMKELKEEGFTSLVYLNMGGGLGIPYEKQRLKTKPPSATFGMTNGYGPLQDTGSQTTIEQMNGHCPNSPVHDEKQDESPGKVPSPATIVAAIGEIIQEHDVILILEPGRSLIGNAGTLVTSTLGVKHSGRDSFIVVDGAMTEVIRPSLYGAYHHIDLAEPSTDAEKEGRHRFHVVGPVCESADFLGKNRYLRRPHPGCAVAVFDTGAYCSSMASNYNIRARPAEVLVSGSSWRIIRRPDTFSDIMAPYDVTHDQRASK